MVGLEKKTEFVEIFDNKTKQKHWLTVGATYVGNVIVAPPNRLFAPGLTDTP